MTITIKGRTIDLTTNQRVNAFFLLLGFALLWINIGFTGALGFACLAIYCKNGSYE